MPKKLRAPEPGPFIRVYAEVAPEVLNERFAPNRCLNAARICLDVMGAFNVRALPLSVGMSAFNREYFERFTKRGGFPNDDAELDVWLAAGAWALGIDTRAERTDARRNAWGGHLVALVQDEWIVDGASIQFNRPEKGIVFPDVFVGHVERAFTRGRLPAVFSSAEGACVNYRARLDDRSYQTCAGFLATPENTAAAEEIARRMAERMGIRRRAALRVSAS